MSLVSSQYVRILTRSGAACRIIICHQLPDTRDQLLAILDSVRPGIVASDQQAGGAQLVVFEQRPRDRLGCADERRRVPWSTRRGGERRPQACVVHLGFRGSLQQSLGAEILAFGCRSAAAIE